MIREVLTTQKHKHPFTTSEYSSRESNRSESRNYFLLFLPRCAVAKAQARGISACGNLRKLDFRMLREKLTALCEVATAKLQ